MVGIWIAVSIEYGAPKFSGTDFLPCAIADAIPLTQAGYVGEDVENIILYLLQNADYDIFLQTRKNKCIEEPNTSLYKINWRKAK